MTDTVSKRRSYYIFLIFVMTLFQAGGSSLIKYGMALLKADPMNRIYFLVFAGALCLYLLAFPLYALTLSRLKLSVVQPVGAGSIFLYTIVISIVFFSESLTLLKAGGILAIVGGIILVAL